ncbi:MULTISPECIES: hypothetical protein [Methylocaldum]|jgi:hypothetical protein|uniref:hypothetical protein n=1 Tax=unclassified Methylocaldum TaxID=2622260 RepID=UPI00098B9660|nr:MULTISPECIES: hypothetical protein [unclassified Methylocaldum]MBP1148249.1 hypothetical protein [Methylocaldum sp. RMAD-M]MDV3242179.1 hypothetical protein [Methylocaldum sp.]MVF24930.1 hypothetical protein [Methylocaldum sp. BRCS4]
MNQVRILEEMITSGDADSAPQSWLPGIKERVVAYLQSLGLSRQDLIENLADDCLNRARRRVGRGAGDELLKRAIEEAQRRFDHALARAMRLSPSKDPHPIAAARAALLLTGCPSASDALFGNPDPPSETGEMLREILPRPTPPEDSVPMAEQPLRFWLFKSTHQSS